MSAKLYFSMRLFLLVYLVYSSCNLYAASCQVTLKEMHLRSMVSDYIFQTAKPIPQYQKWHETLSKITFGKLGLPQQLFGTAIKKSQWLVFHEPGNDDVLVGFTKSKWGELQIQTNRTQFNIVRLILHFNETDPMLREKHLLALQQQLPNVNIFHTGTLQGGFDHHGKPVHISKTLQFELKKEQFSEIIEFQYHARSLINTLLSDPLNIFTE